MTPKVRLIRTVYLYIIAAISLIFLAIGTGTLINIGLKALIFPEAEKKSYFECNQQPPVYGSSDFKSMSAVATDDQKVQLDNLLKDYAAWRENNSGNKCIVPARQNKLVDAIVMMIIALPILFIHWRIIKKEKEDKTETMNSDQ
jgi:hypothetical protein